MAVATNKLVLLMALVACSAWRPGLVKAADVAAPPVIHALRPQVGSAGDLGVPCDSWRLTVETYNKRDWRTVPASCEGYVGHYMLGGHYRQDSRAVVDEAVAYAEGLRLAGNGKEVWVSTSTRWLSPTSPTTPSTASALSRTTRRASTSTYWREARRCCRRHNGCSKSSSLGIKPVFLTGRTEDKRAITVSNLRRQGYSGWMNLLLKPVGLKATAIVYKSGERQKLQDAGYIIVGNIGDQWSDILGMPEGARTFKLPDPLYYIG